MDLGPVINFDNSDEASAVSAGATAYANGQPRTSGTDKNWLRAWDQAAWEAAAMHRETRLALEALREAQDAIDDANTILGLIEDHPIKQIAVGLRQRIPAIRHSLSSLANLRDINPETSCR